MKLQTLKYIFFSISLCLSGACLMNVQFATIHADSKQNFASENSDLPFPIHYNAIDYSNIGTALNKEFPRFGEAMPFSNDSTSQLLKDGYYNTIGGVNTNNTISFNKDYQITGTIYIEPWGLGQWNSGDGFSIGFHSDRKNAQGKTGGNLGIDGIKNGYFFAIDLYKNEGELDAPFIHSMYTDENGSVHSKGMSAMYQTDNKGERQTGMKAVFNDFYKSKYGYFTPFDYVFKYEASSRLLTFSLKNHKFEEQTTIKTSQFHIPENISSANFYAAGVTGGKRSNYKLNIDRVVYSEYKTNTPTVKSVEYLHDPTDVTMSEKKYAFKIENPDAKSNKNQPVDFPEGSKVICVIDNKETVESVIDDNSTFLIDNNLLLSGTHTLEIKVKSKYTENKRTDFASLSDSLKYKFDAGVLSFETVPGSITFGMNKIQPYTLRLFGKPSQKLSISDTRMPGKKTGWQLLLKNEDNVIGKESNLTYVNKQGKELNVNDQFQVVETSGKSNAELEIISNEWSQNGKGLFLNVSPEKQKIGVYSGKIAWLLQDVPN